MWGTFSKDVMACTRLERLMLRLWPICNVSFGAWARIIEPAFTFVWMKLQS